MERDTSRDQSGDQAAWRDLVARLELPSAIDPANAPWPDRENLHPAHAAPDDAAEPGSASAGADPGSPSGGADPAGSENTAAPGTAGPPANRGRVIRPASFSFVEPADGHRSSDDDTAGETTHPDLGFRLLGDQDDQDADERYVPPEVPPLPKLDPVAKGAWAALFGGPGYLFIATTLGWEVSGWAQLAAIVAFVSGFVILVSRLGDGPSRRDGPDQGAVV